MPHGWPGAHGLALRATSREKLQTCLPSPQLLAHHNLPGWGAHVKISHDFFADCFPTAGECSLTPWWFPYVVCAWGLSVGQPEILLLLELRLPRRLAYLAPPLCICCLAYTAIFLILGRQHRSFRIILIRCPRWFCRSSASLSRSFS